MYRGIKMNSRERIEAAIKFQPVDRVPTALFDGGVWAMKKYNMSLSF